MLSCMAGMLAGMFAAFVRDPRRRRQGHAAAAWVDYLWAYHLFCLTGPTGTRRA